MSLIYNNDCVDLDIEIRIGVDDTLGDYVKSKTKGKEHYQGLSEQFAEGGYLNNSNSDKLKSILMFALEETIDRYIDLRKGGCKNEFNI